MVATRKYGVGSQIVDGFIDLSVYQEFLRREQHTYQNMLKGTECIARTNSLSEKTCSSDKGMAVLTPSRKAFSGPDTQNSVRHATISLMKCSLFSSVTGTSRPFSIRSTVEDRRRFTARMATRNQIVALTDS